MAHPKEDSIFTHPHMHCIRDRKHLSGSLRGNHGNFRESAEAESQAMADSIDVLNFIRRVFVDGIHLDGIDLRRPHEILKLLPESCAITDCKSLYDALEKSESLGLGLSEKTNNDRSDCDTTTNASDKNQDEMGKQRSTTCGRSNQTDSISHKHTTTSKPW